MYMACELLITRLVTYHIHIAYSRTHIIVNNPNGKKSINVLGEI
jgi:hypothetical protein